MNMANVSCYRTDESVCDEEDLSRRLLVNCSGMTVISQPFRTFRPAGRQDYYLMLLLEGELDAQSGDDAFHLTPGDLLIYTPRQAYGYQLSRPGRMIYLWVHFTGSGVPELLSTCGLQTASVFHLASTDEPRSDFEAIQRLLLTRPAFFCEEASLHLELLLTHLGRALHISARPRPADRLQTSLQYLNTHYAQPLHLDVLAGMEFLSPSRYSALFRRATGVSPQQYLIRLRLHNARELLTNTDLSVSEIARSVGYDDPLYFSRLFRRHTGQSPSALQKRPRSLP